MGPVPGDCDSVTLPVCLPLSGSLALLVSLADSTLTALQAEGIKAWISSWKS